LFVVCARSAIPSDTVVVGVAPHVFRPARPLSASPSLSLSFFAVLSEFAFKVKSIEIKLIEKMFSEFLAFAFIFVLPWTGTFIFINNHFKINISVSMGQAAVHCTVRINCGR